RQWAGASAWQPWAWSSTHGRARRERARAQTESGEGGGKGPARGGRREGEGGAARIGGPGWLEVSRRAVVTAAQNQITVKDQTIVQFPRSRRGSHAPGKTTDT